MGLAVRSLAIFVAAGLLLMGALPLKAAPEPYRAGFDESRSLYLKIRQMPPARVQDAASQEVDRLTALLSTADEYTIVYVADILRLAGCQAGPALPALNAALVRFRAPERGDGSLLSNVEPAGAWGALHGAILMIESDDRCGLSRITRARGDGEGDARCAVIVERSQNGDVIRVCEEIFQRLWSQGEQAERYLQITGYVAYLDHTPHLFASKDTYLYSGGRGGVRLELPPSERGRFDRVAAGGGAVTVAGHYAPGREGSNVIGSLEVIGRHYWEQGLPGEMPPLPED